MPMRKDPVLLSAEEEMHYCGTLMAPAYTYCKLVKRRNPDDAPSIEPCNGGCNWDVPYTAFDGSALVLYYVPLEARQWVMVRCATAEEYLENARQVRGVVRNADLYREMAVVIRPLL